LFSVQAASKSTAPTALFRSFMTISKAGKPGQNAVTLQHFRSDGTQQCQSYRPTQLSSPGAPRAYRRRRRHNRVAASKAKGSPGLSAGV
jgi:hypothetical protein